MKPQVLLLGTFLGLIIQGCVTSPPKPDYSHFFEHHPRSIVVVPAFNNTTAVDAPVVFDTTVTRPFAERGYYVFPVFLTRDVLIDMGLSDEGILSEVTPQRFKEVFGADAVLYSTINEWVYMALNASVRVTINYKLVDTSSGMELWEQTRTAIRQGGGGGGGGLIGALVAAAVNAALTASADYRSLAIQANTKAVNPKGIGLPAGPYHPEFKTDYPNYQ